MPAGSASSYDEDDDVHDTDDNDGNDDDNDNGGYSDNGKGNGNDHYLRFACGAIGFRHFSSSPLRQFCHKSWMCGSAGLWFRRNGSLKTPRFTVGSLKHPVLNI